MSKNFSQVPFILLCCQGRSGSTLLLRHLNSIDGYHIMGENAGGIQHLLHFYLQIKHTDSIRKLPKEEEHYHSAYANSFKLEKIKDTIYQLFQDLYWAPDKKVFGYKDIAFGFVKYSNKNAYECFENEMDLLKELFPNLKIIFLTRNINELIKSSWWALDVKNSKQILLAQEQNFKKYHKNLINKLSKNEKAFTFHITYSEICKESETFLRMLDFLEEDYNESRFSKVSGKVTA